MVKADALRLLELVQQSLIFEIDHDNRREEANTRARADIVVGDVVLAKDVPATMLLPLEKSLRALKAELDKLPTLDPSVEWTWDAASETYRGAPELVNRTKKEPRVIEKVKQDEHHPGQADVIYEDRAVGTYTKTPLSKAVSPARKRQLGLRAVALADAVKAAIERANHIEAPPAPLGAALLNFVFAG